MHSKKQLLAQYVLHCRWFVNVLEGFTDEETNERINADMNHVKYLAGHLLNAQYAFAQIAGITVTRKWDELFAGQGKSKARDNFPYPSIDEIKATWDQLYPVVKSALEKMPEEALQKELPASPVAGHGILDSTVGDLWAFLNLHQAYHIGQIGILRRGFKKDPMKYF
ncbi:DinB family protein [Compostibacter hankyongensis]